MKVLIVAKTRRGGGACIGGIAEDGRSVRLIAVDADRNQHAGLEYAVGDVWEIDWAPDPSVIPPHIENIIVLRGRRLRSSQKMEEVIHRYMPPVRGGPEKLFDGLAQASATGGLYMTRRTGLPTRSTMFWISDQPLHLDCEGKRLHYRYPTSDGGRTLTFVGFQEPVPTIPAGTLLRVSLAHWWRPKDRPDEELRCRVQLSGWFITNTELPVGVQALACSRPQKQAKACTPTAVGSGQSNDLVQIDLLPRAREVLKQTFGFGEFLPTQRDAIARVLQRQDTFVVMPTGGGKSLCYQLPALLFDGLTVVASPLIALMQDQVAQLRELNVPAAFLNSTVPHSEYLAVMNKIRRGNIKIVYGAPETLLRPETLLLLEQSNLACLAVDEAHCISEWGHDFRPEYRRLAEVRKRFPAAVCLALTATATGRVRDDIRRLLGIAREGEFVASFNRPNLFLTVKAREDGLAQTIAFLERHRGESGIIYCGTRKQTDELTDALNANGLLALPYHAGLEDAVRRNNQERFVHDEVPLMVATVAFGMGINKSNVRFVLHYHLPKDLESYYQEIGRAGRDGLAADCLLLYSRGDAMTIRHFICQGAESERAGREERLKAMMRFAEARECRRVPLLSYFGETAEKPCGHCDNCGSPIPVGELADATVAAQKFLSCVKRTGEKFGLPHIVDVLRGSKSQKVLSQGHDRVSTYGIGKEHSKKQWRGLARQFVKAGLLESDLGFGNLSITSKGWGVLKNQEKVLVSLEKLEGPGRRAPSAQYDPELFQYLRELRKEFAARTGAPAYIIFSDRTLIEMATQLPQTEDQLLAINGVGQFKMANYGQPFLQAIRNHCHHRSLQSEARVTDLIRPVSRRSQEIGELFIAGHSIDAIVTRFQLQRETVINHLYRFVQAGRALDCERLWAESRLFEADRARVLAAFEKLGLERLAPVHQELGGKAPYEELHLLRLCLQSGVRPRSVSTLDSILSKLRSRLRVW